MSLERGLHIRAFVIMLILTVEGLHCACTVIDVLFQSSMLKQTPHLRCICK